MLKIDNSTVADSIPYLWDTTKYADGLHRIQLTAIDSFGEKDQSMAFVIVDNTLPSITITSPVNSTTYPTGFTGSPDGYYNVGVQMSLPIFQKNQRNIKRQKSFIQREQLNIQKDDAIVSIKRNVNDVILSIISQYSNIELSKVSTEAAKESLELMQVSYSNGAIGITSLIDSQQAYFQAQQQQANATYNFQLSILQLERIMSYFFLLHTDEENQAFISHVKEKIVR